MRSILLFTSLVIFALLGVESTRAQERGQQRLQKGQLLEAPVIEYERDRFTGVAKMSSSANIVYEEGFEGGTSRWTSEGTWAIGEPRNGPEDGFDSPNAGAIDLSGEYPNGSNDRLISPSISLPEVSSSSELLLHVREWFEIESDYDEGVIEVSTDGGSTWIELSSRSGSSSWRDTQVNLTSYAGQDVKLAFHITSDESITFSGWYVDDVQISLNKTRPLSASITGLNPQQFPFIFSNVEVDTSGSGIGDLSESNFEVYENGILQTGQFEVFPPEEGGDVRRTDVVFLIDNTGSMGEEISQVRDNVISFVDRLESSEVDFSLGLITYKDDVDTYFGGTLISDASEFQETVGGLSATGGGGTPENGLGALQVGLNSISFRPGSQKIFILITDATSHAPPPPYVDPPDPEPPSLSEINQSMNAAGITTYAAGIDDPIYKGEGSITNATGGDFFFKTEPFDSILDDVGEDVSDSYVVRYRSSNDERDGTERTVRVEVSYEGNTVRDTASYVAGGFPRITRTEETRAFEDQTWTEGTEFTIEAEVKDDVAPSVQGATVSYKNTSDPTSAYESVAMSAVNDSLYEAKIPGSAVGPPGLDYYITATDGEVTSSLPSVNPASNPYQIAILPNKPPEIEHTPVTELTSGSPIPISATIVDNTDSLVSTTLYYRQVGDLTYTNAEMTNTSGNVYEAEIPGSVMTEDGIQYYIEATDDLGISSTSGTADAPYSVEAVAAFPASNLLDAMALTQELVTAGNFEETGAASSESKNVLKSGRLSQTFDAMKARGTSTSFDNLEEEFQNGIGHQAYISGGAYKALDIGVYVDLDDVAGITKEGKNGWVTVYIEAEASAGLGTPVSFGLLKTDLKEDKADLIRGLQLAGPSLSATNAIKLEYLLLDGEGGGNYIDASIDNSYDFNPSASLLSAATSLMRFEIRKPALNDILSEYKIIDGQRVRGIEEDDLQQGFTSFKESGEIGSVGDVLYIVYDLAEAKLRSDLGIANFTRDFTAANDGEAREFAAYIESASGGIDRNGDDLPDNYCPVDPDPQFGVSFGWQFLVNVRAAGEAEAKYAVEVKDVSGEGWDVRNRLDITNRVVTDESLSPGELGSTSWTIEAAHDSEEETQVTFAVFPLWSEEALDEVTVTLRRYKGTLVAYNGRSPIELSVETSSGETIGASNYNGGQTMYNQFDVDGNETEDAQVLIASPTEGRYSVEVTPESDAQPTDTYTLEAIEGGKVRTLAEDVSIEDIPEDPYVHVAGRPSTIEYDISQNFGGADEAGDYRLVALPGQVERPLEDAVSGQAGTEWQAFWDTGTTEDYLTEYDGSDVFTFRPGRGFWLTSRQEWTVSDSVPVVALDGDGTAAIPLHEGWNIISNPLRAGTSWSAVKKANGGALQPAWAFDGSFQRADTLRSAVSGRAYYFLNDRGLNSLMIPYPSPAKLESGKTVATESEGKKTRNAEKVAMALVAEGGDALRSEVQVGIDPDAAAGLGTRDVVAPPSRFSALSLRLKASEDAPARKRRLATEWRPPTDPTKGQEKGHTFSLRLQAETSGPIEFKAEGLSALEGREVALLRPSTGQSYDLRAQQAVTLQSVDSTALQLAIGSAAFVKDKRQSVVPDEVTLTSYPNPLRRQATVAYTLPEASDVQITVYDMLGRRVSVLENGRREAGRHRVTLDGDRLASGVYFGRLQVGEKTLTQKITVVR